MRYRHAGGLPVSAGIYLLACARSIFTGTGSGRPPQTSASTRTTAQLPRPRDCRYHRLMPKIVDHAQRRDEIALVACRVVADHGFDRASMVRIARAAGYTTGMLAHYFDTKQDIIIAALRLILRRIDERLIQPTAATARPDLLALLTEALPVDEHRRTECAFWTTFWGQVSTDKRLSASTLGAPRVHAPVRTLLAQCWPEWSQWSPAKREQVAALARHLHQRTHASAVANAGDWPAERQIRAAAAAGAAAAAWAMGTAGAPFARQAAGAQRPQAGLPGSGRA